MFISVIAALLAGVCFASAGVLQQRAAHAKTGDESLSLQLLRDLARQPMWVAGISLAVLSYGFQAVALNFGPLSVVQPLIVTEVVFALPIAARLDRISLGIRDWLGAACVTGGLALALFMASPSGKNADASTLDWVILLSAVGVVAAVALAAGRREKGVLRASLFAAAGASVMGTQSALFDTTVHNIHHGFVAVFTAWQTYLLVLASIGGLLLTQSAYNSGPLAASMPVIDLIEPTLAVAVGVLLFGETLHPGLAHRVLAGAGALVAVAGILLLDTSPTTRAMQKTEQQAQRGRDSSGGGRPGRGSKQQPVNR